jgi:SET domain-containing protein
MLPVSSTASAPLSGEPRSPGAPAVPRGRKLLVRRSPVHGRGVFAARDLAQGETVIEYTGEIISWQEAQDRHPHDPEQPNHTFYFHVDDDHVIDGGVGGNASRWINHACDPNCETDQRGLRMFIVAIRPIARGEEITYDYGLMLQERHTARVKAEYPCWCGSPQCRGTLLAPKRPPARKRTAGAP